MITGIATMRLLFLSLHMSLVASLSAEVKTCRARFATLVTSTYQNQRVAAHDKCRTCTANCVL
jgi:hypothetical protein